MVRKIWGTAIVVALLTGCGPEGAHILYEQDVQSLDNPLPDLRLRKDGVFMLRPQWYRPFMMDKALNARMARLLDGWADQARSLKGFGNLGTTLLRTSEPVTAESFENAVARLQKTDDGYKVLERNVVVEHSTAAAIRSGAQVPDNVPQFVLVRPSVPLPENQEGLLVVLKGPTTAKGEPLVRGRSFDTESGSAELIRAAATALEVPESDVLLTLPLAAQPASGVMRQVSDWVNAQPPPATTIPARAIVGGYPVGTWTSTGEGWSTMLSWLSFRSWGNPASDVGSVTVGTFKSRDLRDANGVWKDEWVADPSAAPLADVPFVLTLPKTKPVGGYRLAICAHGLGGRNTPLVGNTDSTCLQIAQVMAKAGFATLGMDSLNHGKRGSSVERFNLVNMLRTRENFRQSMFDMVQLTRMARSLDVDPSLFFIGDSLGSIEMAGAFPYAPDIKTGSFNVAGAELGNLVSSLDVQGKVGLLMVAETGLIFESPEYYAAFALYRALGQWLLEAADPINLAERVQGRAALIIMSIGDGTLPNFTTEHLASVMGLTAYSATVESTEPLLGLYGVDPTRYLSAEALKTYNPHGLFWDTAAVRAQAVTFLQTNGRKILVE